MISAGAFMMGSDQGQENEQPIHRVWLDDFGIGRYPVTNQDYSVFLEQTGSAAPPFWFDSMFSAPEQPVVGVTWDEAVAFCGWLSERSGRRLRLPTEAEWERATRGGVEGTLYPWGNEAPWEKQFVGCDAVNGGPARVGINEPNAFGLYDLSEGVHEWCSDFMTTIIITPRRSEIPRVLPPDSADLRVADLGVIRSSSAAAPRAARCRRASNTPTMGFVWR